MAGGEFGPRVRTMKVWWVEQLHEACERQGTTFFFKQWGGKRKKKAGWTFKDRTWDDYPCVTVQA